MFWWPLICLPIAWFLQNIIHESSHLFAGWLFEGRKAIKLIPYPHYYNDRFYFARYEAGEATNYLWPGEAARHVSPTWAAAIWIFLVGFIFVKFLPISWVYIIWPFLITAAVDIGFWWYGYFFGSEYSDGKRYRKAIRETVND